MTPEPQARLLIVDDETAQMRALCETLKLEGYATRGFSSAREALAALRPGRSRPADHRPHDAGHGRHSLEQCRESRLIRPCRRS